MKKLLVIITVFITILSCETSSKEDTFQKVDWSSRSAVISKSDSLKKGTSYLSIYSQIYSLSQHKRYNLTAMVSLRNTSLKDTLFLLNADYYDTHGKLIKSYFTKPVFITPMETLDIVIEESDISGGTGSNFIFGWKTPKDCPEPIFEAVMSSTVGSQGLSFTTQAKRIN